MNRKVYGYRNYPASSASIAAHYQIFDVGGGENLFSISSAGAALWGGDSAYDSYGQTLQHTRLYLDYVPTSSGQMLNLAWMHLGGIRNQILLFMKRACVLGFLYFFDLSTDYDVVTNATIPLIMYLDATQTTLTVPICKRILYKLVALKFLN